jgi:hypothetical protein
MMTEERVAQRRSSRDAVDQVRHDGLQTRRGGEFFKDRQRAIEREPRLEQRGQLLREGEQLAGAHAPAGREGKRGPEPAPLGMRLDADRVKGLAMETLHHGAGVGRFHDAVDGLAPTVGSPVGEDRHGPVRRLPG